MGGLPLPFEFRGLTNHCALKYGIGSPVPVDELHNVFDGSLKLVWSDEANSSAIPSPSDIMTHITSDFSQKQRLAIRKVDTASNIPSLCPQNFNLFSECFAAVAFHSFPSTSDSSQPINYTIQADGGLFHIDVVKHTSDYELRILPLQWAIDRVSSLPRVFAVQTDSAAIGDHRVENRYSSPLTIRMAIHSRDQQRTIH